MDKVIFVLFSMWALSTSAHAESRYEATSPNAPADAFMLNQSSSSSINSSYLKVAIKNKILREINTKLNNGSSASDNTRNTAQSVLEQSGLVSVDNSVVVLPGAIDFAGEVTIVNIQSDSGNSTVGLFE